MNTYIIILFIIAAAIGLYLYMQLLRGNKRPIFLVAIHGIIAVAAYGVLTFSVSSQVREMQLADYSYPLESYAFVFFSFAILMGLYMFFRDKYLKIGLKSWMPLLHAGLAATGLVILIIAAIIQ